MSDTSEDPRQWVKLHWKKEHLLFHYGVKGVRSNLKTSKRDITK